uniref:adenylate kinase n=1 Tax=Salix viminalis TaxID=40686 RepID=A0A6N2K3C2_SALVM
MIRNFKLEGKIVPSEVTVGILQQAMQQSENKKFIIDGFPRNEENLATFEKTVKVEPEFVLFFDCPEEELKRRLLSRNQINAQRSVEQVFDDIRNVFSKLNPGSRGASTI